MRLVKILTAWSFAGGVPPRTEMCKVSNDHMLVSCAGHASFACPSVALANATKTHVTRFRCRVIGRDDHGMLRCIPGKPSLDYDATKVLFGFARSEALRVSHLWAAPPVVKQYLRTGNPETRRAARVAAKIALLGEIAPSTEAAIRAAVEATETFDPHVNAWGAASHAAWSSAFAQATEGDESWVRALDVERKRQSRSLARVLQAGAR